MPKQAAPKTLTEQAAALCRRFPDAPNLTLAKRLYADNIESCRNVEAARSAVRQIRGALGKNKAAERHRVPRPKQKAGWTPEFPASLSEDWLPLELPTPCRVLSLSDLHIPYHSKEAIEAAVSHAKKLHRPDVVIADGDFGDFYQISRHQRDAKARSFKQETDTMKEALAWLKGQFPKSRRIFKLGNHEERWDVYIYNKGPEIWDLKNVQLHNILEFDKHGFERVDDVPIMAGKLPILHGHEFGKSGIAAPVNPARGAFLRTLHTCLIGHLHRSSSHCEPDMFKREIMTWSQGCLCDLSPRYSRINKWSWGYAVIDVASDGSFNVHNYRLNGRHEVRAA